MNREPQGTLELYADSPADVNQFRLTKIQIFNWGTFNGVVHFAIPRNGYLFLGPSGSGKSTVLDAHAAILTPPKWVDFNVAGRHPFRVHPEAPSEDGPPCRQSDVSSPVATRP